MNEWVENFTETLREEISSRDLKVFALEQSAGLPPDAIRNVLRSGKSGPSLTRAYEICGALGLELYIGPKRFPANQPDDVADDTEFVKVNRYDVKLSAGNGSAGHNEEPMAPIAFRANWMRDQGLVASSCCVVSVVGDSMEPTLLNGDLVLVDRSNRPFKNRAIYAFSESSGDAKVKRLEKTADHLIITSDNPEFSTAVMSQSDANSLDIIGRVIWTGHVVK